MLLVGPGTHIGANFRKHHLRRYRSNPGDVRQIHSYNAPQFGTQTKRFGLRLGRIGLLRRSITRGLSSNLSVWGSGGLGQAALESLHLFLQALLALLNLLPIMGVGKARLLQRKELLGFPVSLQRFAQQAACGFDARIFERGQS